MYSIEMSDEAVLQEIGFRLKRERLNQNMSQDELSEEAGIGRRTITNVENGKGGSMVTFVAMLRALKVLDQLDLFLPPNSISPIEISNRRGYQRQRATGTRGSDSVAENGEKYGKWEWGE